MRIDPIQFQENNSLMREYRSHFENISDKFDYHPFEESSWQERHRELMNRHFQREELSEVLKKMNGAYGAGDMTLAHIERLKEKESTVMITGQQAGLLTGPLYTVNKAISVIEAAKQKEKQLGVPVLPVFWIAGEDHDFEEIDHIYTGDKGLTKQRIHQTTDGKTSVSDVDIDQQAGQRFIDECFRQLQETQYTKSVYNRMKEALESSKTYTDFFARILIALFKDQGLIVVDAHSPAIRQMESDYFVRMIEHNEALASGVYTREQENRRGGYPVLMDVERRDAHLFYHEKGRRILLVREGSRFVGKQEEISFEENELLMVAEETPWKLSNNVVTRPLMQDLLFPVLGFIGGPGEITYWSALRPAFRELSIHMPPVLPRLSFTFVEEERRIAARKEGIDLYEVLRYGLGEQKMNYISSGAERPLDLMKKQAKREIAKIHRPLREEAERSGADISAFADKNLMYIESLVDELTERISKENNRKYRQTLDFYNSLEEMLKPFGGLQERVWNPLYFLNRFGWNFFTEIPEYSWDFRRQHYLLYR